MSVLIVTMPGDVHAHAVRWAIESIGGSARLVYPADLCDGARWTLDPSVRKLSIEHGGRADEIGFDDYRTIWMRRPPATLPQERMTDEVESAVSEDDFGTLARSVYLLMERGRFAVNPADASRTAGLKPYQFSLAQEVGLDLPRTLVGNSPEVILDFYERCGGDVVFKPFRSPVWQTEQGPRMVPTTRLSREMLLGSDLAAAPGIFQERVIKHSEVRATVMGRSVFAWEKRFEDRDDLDVDWRFMFRNAKHSLHRLPAEVEAACFALLDALGLVFGCFDFVIDGAGRYYFLEVNPQGQWLWGDSINQGLNQLEGMAEFLLSGDPRFRYSGRNRISYSDFSREQLAAACRAEEEQHHGHLMTFLYHQRSFRMETASKV